MSQWLKAIYHKGAFIPQESCDIPEGSEVELIVQGPFIFPPRVNKSEERETILRKVVERMQQNPIPEGVPQLTREVLHDRR